MNGKAMQICMFVKYSFEKYKGTTPFFVRLKKGRILVMGFAGLMEPSQHILRIISHVLAWNFNT